MLLLGGRDRRAGAGRVEGRPRGAPTARRRRRGRAPTTAWRCRRGAAQRSSTQRDGTRSLLRRRSPRGTPSSVAPRAGEGGEELAVLALDPVGAAAASSPPARGALVVGEERVVAHGGGERALGQAEHDDEVEVEADAHLDGADEHAVAEAADPAEVVLELELEGAVEHVERRPGPRRRRARRAGASASSTRSAALRSAGSAQRSRRAAPPSSRASQRVAHAACSLQRLRPGGGAARSSITPSTKARSCAGPLGVGPQPLGQPLGLLVVELGLGGVGRRRAARAG